MKHAGSCHCGSVQVSLDIPTEAEAITPRACQCTFCRKNGINWYSDACGQLFIHYDAAQKPIYYRFGMKIADFIICARCGVCLAAIEKEGDQARAVINLNCLDYDKDWSESSIPTDFGQDNPEDRMDRHQKNWMPVQIIRKPK